ncbi:acyl carrier protein [Streptomyces pathocidini]|uniref:Acyl carrier protein n=1 Tax=Streptomyces pathocidini TaxID=1650571 RepID=A0ABW7UV73_9ACTN|nr:acyl carrier protein [Streptomyces pathocidini]
MPEPTDPYETARHVTRPHATDEVSVNAIPAAQRRPHDPDPDTVDAGLLDCVQANLGVLADHHHGPGTHLRLGARLRFHCHPGEDGLPTVDPPLDTHLAEAERVLGLRVATRARLAGEGLLDAVRAAGGAHRYVVADAHALPWLPYHRRAHMDHSFLLAAGPDGWHVTDAYRNETRWGAADPGQWTLADSQLAEITTAEVLDLRPVELPKEPDPAWENGPTEEYLAAYGTCPDRARALHRLTAETWLLTRARKLHARYRERAGLPVDQDHLRRWDAVQEQTYLAHRRVERGRAEPSGLLQRLREALAADEAAFGGGNTTSHGSAASEPGPADAALRRSVAAIVAAVLGAAEPDLLDGAAFDTYATFSSFRLVEIIERLEAELDLELDPDALVPENLHRVDDLCRIAR